MSQSAMMSGSAKEIRLEPVHSAGRIVGWLVALAGVGTTAGLYQFGYQPRSEALRRANAALGELRDVKRDGVALQASLQEARKALANMRGALTLANVRQAESAELVGRIQRALAQSGVDVSGDTGRIVVTLVERILFDSGQAEVTERGRLVLARLGGVLQTIDDRIIQVGGHTDDVPISPDLQAKVATNWELSTARATNVVRYFHEQAGVDARRLMAAGFGAYRPVASNGTDKGRSRNRRIEVILLPDDFKVVRGKPPQPVAAPAAAPSGSAGGVPPPPPARRATK